ncbi:hypothetical protein TNCV_934931 [Trichonephila clavipes]|nr:hypothetical protein TNCV_934931 [Trichonephila clavipes]
MSKISAVRGRNSCAEEQFQSDARCGSVNRGAPNTKSWQWTTEGDAIVRKSTLAPYGSVNDLTASSKQLAACCSTATGVLKSASSIR